MNNHRPAIIVHGGASQFPEEEIAARLTGCREAAVAGWHILKQGGSALDAAQTTVVALEDNPLFNAGIGAPLNAVGEVELDASIMDGARLAAGAVAAVQGIKNPIMLARKILEDGRHILLAGEGARRFAHEIGMPVCAMEDLITQRQRQRWQASHDTVGCVALDTAGRLAAATSTGGLFGKLSGRVGDSALIGSGTYADERGGVSCTGIGEAIIRVVLAKTALDFLHQGHPPAAAAQHAISLLTAKTASEAGLIMIDRHGRIAHARNTPHMPVCVIRDSGEILTQV